jgi:putative ubiquitin-RnfH superfamily antitoxin RatB of RatAB toxin-antitoxin module
MTDAEEGIVVTVVYALTERQFLRELTVPAGTTVATAVHLSGLREEFPDIDRDAMAIGIFGKRVRLDDMLQDGDRVEIYRKLLLDPKEARRRRDASR